MNAETQSKVQIKERVYCNNPLCVQCAKHFGWWTPDFFEPSKR